MHPHVNSFNDITIFFMALTTVYSVDPMSIHLLKSLNKLNDIPYANPVPGVSTLSS